jgi:hypothetical protein
MLQIETAVIGAIQMKRMTKKNYPVARALDRK